jgi:hypothetical protein
MIAKFIFEEEEEEVGVVAVQREGKHERGSFVKKKMRLNGE